MRAMDFQRLHDSRHADFALLRAAVAATDPGAKVPSCPDWTVDDLAHHVSMVYLHKAECLRDGAFPDPWPPARTEPDPLAELDQTIAALDEQFAALAPSAPAPSWFQRDPTVGFWIRRMAHETLVHRIDAELAAGGPVSPIPDDIAIDGVDELLTVFLDDGSVRRRTAIAGLFASADHRPILIRTAGRAWLVTTEADTLAVTDATPTTDAALTVTGTPEALELWLWNRAGDDLVTIAGDPSLATQFHTFRERLT